MVKYCMCGCGNRTKANNDYLFNHHRKGNTYDGSLKRRPGSKILWHGYVYVKSKDYRNNGNRGYVPEHRLIIEKHLGRKLNTGRFGHNETVHHKNGVKTDNRIENLELHTNCSHGTLEMTNAWKKGKFDVNRTRDEKGRWI